MLTQRVCMLVESSWCNACTRRACAWHPALQVHGGGNYTDQYVRYRNVRVKELD